MPKGNPERRERIMSMLDSGMTQAEVASVFGITPTRVGQIKRCEILRRKQAVTPLHKACLDLNLDTGLASRISAACRRSGKDWREDDMSNVRTIGPLFLTIIERAKELSMANWTTKWTGEYPCLCHGEWELYKDGVLVNTDIPFQGSPANTYGTYQEWFFAGEDYEEDWDEYEDGETEAQWCANNRQWLETLADADEWPDIYVAFQENDWRRGSCGGCI